MYREKVLILLGFLNGGLLMTDDDAVKVAKIALTADGWCSTCHRHLIEQLMAAFPENAAAIGGVYDRAREWEDAWREANDGRFESGEDEISVLDVALARAA